MAHRSGGGSHGGGHHSGGHHSSHRGGRGGSNAPRYSNTPFPNSRRFRYYDRHGRERFLYSDRVPVKTSIFFLIFQLLFIIPFIWMGLLLLLLSFISFFPPRPLTPEYKSPEVHIQDSADVIDNEDSLEEVLQEFEDLTGISPYVMTVYDSDWMMHYDYLDDYAYSEYLNTFSDEQHFLIVYSEPENADELDFVDWSWEAIQGDDTDRILTEANFERFADDLHDDFLRESVSVGKAFENAFQKSLSYMMKKSSNEAAPMGIFAIIWLAIISGAIVSLIKSYKIGRRKYEEMPSEGSGNTVPNAMGASVPYNNATQFGDGTQYNNGMQNAAQYNASMPNNTAQYNNGMPNNMADVNYYNDDARFRGPEYYDDDARYRGSTAYEAGKK